jgi:short-subunit dehydrogenase
MATIGSNKPFAVVTGASSGIGYELSKAFADNGFDLLICAEDPGIQAARSQIAATGASVDAVQVDLATYQGVEQLASRIASPGRPVEAIAINAGVGVMGDFARETSLDVEMRLLALNVVSTVHLAKRVVPRMVERGSGRILFTSSVAGLMPTPLEAVYGASKAFIASFANSLRNELKDTGVTVTTLLPGPTDTNFFHRAGMDGTKAAEEAKKNHPEDVARQAFEALMAGKDQVFGATSIATKLQGAVAKFIPEDVKAKQHAKLMEPAPQKK